MHSERVGSAFREVAVIRIYQASEVRRSLGRFLGCRKTGESFVGHLPWRARVVPPEALQDAFALGLGSAMVSVSTFGCADQADAVGHPLSLGRVVACPQTTGTDAVPRRPPNLMHPVHGGRAG